MQQQYNEVVTIDLRMPVAHTVLIPRVSHPIRFQVTRIPDENTEADRPTHIS